MCSLEARLGLEPSSASSACACPGCPLPGLASVSMGHRDSGLPVLPGGTSETDAKSRWHPGRREELEGARGGCRVGAHVAGG